MSLEQGQHHYEIDPSLRGDIATIMEPASEAPPAPVFPMETCGKADEFEPVLLYARLGNRYRGQDLGLYGRSKEGALTRFSQGPTRQTVVPQSVRTVMSRRTMQN